MSGSNACRLCGGDRAQLVLQLPLSALVRCAACGFVSLAPLPTDEELTAFYQSGYWAIPSAGPGQNAPDAPAGVSAMFRLRVGPVLARLGALLTPGARIVDVGCGAGDFVRLARERGFQALGVDKFAAPAPGILLAKTLEEAGFEDGFADAVTMFHFLEHVRDPLGTLAEAFRILRPGGILLVEVPNADSLALRLFGPRWQPLEVPTHFNFFTPETLAGACRAAAKVQVLRTEQFSLRASPAALVLSAFSGLQPRRVRQSRGHYPAPLAAVYLAAQLLGLPVAFCLAVAGRGCIFRAFIRKREAAYI